MVVAALLVWYASSRNALALLRIALLTGTAAFIVSVVCFAWFALQSARLRAQR